MVKTNGIVLKNIYPVSPYYKGEKLMSHYYSMIKSAHVGLAYATVILFFLRGLGRLLKNKSTFAYFNHPRLNSLSYLVDTCLLLLGVTLLFTLHMPPFSAAWLVNKWIFIVGYIFLGVMAFKNSVAIKKRWIYFGLALFLWLCIYQIARLHQPISALVGF